MCRKVPAQFLGGRGDAFPLTQPAGRMQHRDQRRCAMVIYTIRDVPADSEATVTEVVVMGGGLRPPFWGILAVTSVRPENSACRA